MDVCRFISTHPDNGHILGLEYLDSRWGITNFYAVESSIPGDKKDLSLTKYIELKDSKNFVISKGIKRCWLNEQSEENGSSGILFNHSTTELNNPALYATTPSLFKRIAVVAFL